jgi:hypothetical protein
MKWIIVLLVFLSVSCTWSREISVVEKKQVATDTVYENTLGIPIWPGYRIGGISHEVARPASTESNLNRVIRLVSDYSLVIAAVLFVAAIALGIAGSKIPGIGHLAAFAGAGSALMLVLGAFASWIIWGLGAVVLFVVGYVIFLAVSTERRKMAVERLDSAFGEVVESFDAVKRATAEEWKDDGSLIRKVVDTKQSDTTKLMVAKKRGKVK